VAHFYTLGVKGYWDPRKVTEKKEEDGYTAKVQSESPEAPFRMKSKCRDSAPARQSC